jgi:FkbM family methyltransferase
VYAFEPAPRNLSYLQQLVDLHQLRNVALVGAAVSDSSGYAAFDGGTNPVSGRLAETGSMRVRCIQLDEEVQSGRLPPPDFLKIDVEGAELKLLNGARSTLARYKPEIVLDTHTFLGGEFAPLHQQCSAFLRDLGYNLQSIGSSDPHTSREIHAVAAS